MGGGGGGGIISYLQTSYLKNSPTSRPTFLFRFLLFLQKKTKKKKPSPMVGRSSCYNICWECVRSHIINFTYKKPCYQPNHRYPDSQNCTQIPTIRMNIRITRLFVPALIIYMNSVATTNKMVTHRHEV